MTLKEGFGIETSLFILYLFGFFYVSLVYSSDRLWTHYPVKIFLKILRGGKCGGYHEGKDRYPNHIIQPLFKKFNRKASTCQWCKAYKRG